MNLATMLGRAALRAVIEVAALDRAYIDERSGGPSGAAQLLLAAGLAALILAIPGLLIALLAAGVAPGVP